MSKEKNENRIEIDLNRPKAMVIDSSNFVYKEYLEKVINLISDRVDEIKNIEEQKNKNLKEEFEKSRMHDAILIDGKRGSGKTTFLLNIKDRLKNRDDSIKNIPKVKVLDSIDPNQLDEKSNVLLIIIAHIYTELLHSIRKEIDRDNSKKEQYQRLTAQIHNLTNAISSNQERNYQDDYDKLYQLHKSLIIDEDLHLFFSKVCDFFNVNALILPIDDIDMDFIHGYKVIDAIRKYLSTPKIIPIISIDTSQIYALVKKEHFKYFDYLAHTPKEAIKYENELDFLKKLPEEYLQKILMPTRKVILADIYELYKRHLDKKDKDIIFIYKRKNDNLNFDFSMEKILKLYMNIVYAYNGDEIEDIDEYHNLSYLKDKSFRNFYEDLISLLNGIMKKGERYLYSLQSIKDRLSPMYIAHFDTKYDSTVWFWNRYLNAIKKKMDEYIQRHNEVKDTYMGIFYSDVSQDMLLINSFGEENTIRHEQSYARLYMQDFFINRIELEGVKFKNNREEREENKIIEDFELITKEINIAGLIELITRTMIPMYIFEKLVNEQIVDIFKYNLNELTLFSRDNRYTLKDTMFNLSVSILKYFNNKTFAEKEGDCNKKENIKKEKNYESNKKIIGIFLDEEKKNLFNKDYAPFIERYRDLKKDKDIYFLSPLKYYSMIPYYFKIIEKEKNRDEALKKLIKEYDIFYNDSYYLYPLFNKENLNFRVTNSNLGVITLSDFSQKLVNNILEVSIQDYEKKFITETILEDNFKFKQFINKNVSAYKTIYYNHLILFLVKKIDNKFFDNLKLDYANIIEGTRQEDFEKYKIPENTFAKNIKTIIKEIEKEKGKYESIREFLSKLYLTLLKKYTYQSSYYLIKDDNFNIKKYIEEYYKENKEDNELKELYENLDYLYGEGEYLKNNGNSYDIKEDIAEFKNFKDIDNSINLKNKMYEIAKKLSEKKV